jgi:hypothetical protein
MASRSSSSATSGATRGTRPHDKVDRLTRSLADFAKLVETFDAHGVVVASVDGPCQTGLRRPRFAGHIAVGCPRGRKKTALVLGAPFWVWLRGPDASVTCRI